MGNPLFERYAYALYVHAYEIIFVLLLRGGIIFRGKKHSHSDAASQS